VREGEHLLGGEWRVMMNSVGFPSGLIAKKKVAQERTNQVSRKKKIIYPKRAEVNPGIKESNKPTCDAH
jgi:hypothetical protein